MSDNEVVVRYEPILSLLDGVLYGYEAIPFVAETGERIVLETFYRQADLTGKLFEYDRQFRESAIDGFPSHNGDIKLFLPISAQMACNPKLSPGSIFRKIESACLRPEHVVLLLSRYDEEQNAFLKAALRPYQLQGFRIALEVHEPTPAALRKIVELHPDYAHINMSWLSGEESDPVDRHLLQLLASLAREEQIVMIAGGLAYERMLSPVIFGGMSYGQGEWIGAAQRQGEQTSPVVLDRIREEVNRKFIGAAGSLSELVDPVLQFDRSTLVSDITRQFEFHREAQTIVIAEHGKPVGLLMREKLHQLLSGQFGLPLYWNKSVGKIMDTHPMIVEETVPVDQVSQMAMAREPDKLYDAVIVIREGLVTGIVSVRSMLEWGTQSRLMDAKCANPLTGLPGNESIRREIERRLAGNQPFAIWYADLDHFKWFNDQFGFHRGDEVIRYTGEVLLNTVRSQLPENGFVGHIGGDDFIVLTVCQDPVALGLKALERFGQGIEAYNDKHGGPVRDRFGQEVEATGLTLSLSLLLCNACSGWTLEKISEKAASLKKKAKQLKGNTLVWGMLETEKTDERLEYIMIT